MKKVYEYGIEKELKIDMAIIEYKRNIPNVSGKQVEFATKLTDKIFNLEMDEKIEVNYNRCGMGKSTIIKEILNQLVNHYPPVWGDVPESERRKLALNGAGAIVITDRLKRLEEILNYKGLEDRCYLMKYDKESEDNLYKSNRLEFIEQLYQQKKYPVVLLSTQRYFKMKPEERDNLYTWNGGERKILIVDEKPPIISTDVIDERYLCDIKVELEALPKCNDKKYLIDYWNDFYNYLGTLKDGYNDYSMNWIAGSGQARLLQKELDEKFFKKLEKLASTKLYDSIVKLKGINKDGCLFIANGDKGQDNSRKFVLINNNTDKFDTDKCKIIIFDATAEFDVDYTISDKYNIFKFDDTKEKDIELHHVAVRTSQNALKSDEKHLEDICKYINTLGDNIFVATYGKKSGLYQKLSKGINSNEVAYFGDIKGKNTWNEHTEMAQIGLNRKSNDVYLATYIALTGIDKKWNEIQDGDKIYTEIEKILENNKGMFVNESYEELMQRIMESDLAVDTVQNIMRIKCRHFSNTDMCKVYLLCSNVYNSVIGKINESIGCIVCSFTPPEFEVAKEQSITKKDGTKTVNQRFKEWYNNWNGEKIEVKLAKEQLGFTDKNWENVKKSTTWKNVAGEFEIVREGKKRYLVKC